MVGVFDLKLLRNIGPEGRGKTVGKSVELFHFTNEFLVN